MAEPCESRGCQKRSLHFISDEHWESAHADEGTPDPVIGQMVGDFLVVDLIGAGGFGKVYLAYQTPLLRLKGALKLIDISTDNPEFSRALLQKFQAEAEVLAHLTHPNIVRLLKYGLHAQRPYLVMEYVEGGRTLRDEIHTRTIDERGFGPDEILSIFNQVLNGLGAAHEESIIHRDIKPENIMLQSVVGNPHHTRLLDFGLAKFVEHHTDTRWHLGSPNYMAPEQISRKNLGPWTDLYAVAVIVFELLSGRRPFPGATENEVLIKKVKDDFDPVAEIADLNFPEPAVTFLSTGLARDPEERYADVDALRADLKPAVESLSPRLGKEGVTLEAATAHLGSGDIVTILDELRGESDDEGGNDQVDSTSSKKGDPPPTDDSDETMLAPSGSYPLSDAEDGDSGEGDPPPTDDSDETMLAPSGSYALSDAEDGESDEDVESRGTRSKAKVSPPASTPDVGEEDAAEAPPVPADDSEESEAAEAVEEVTPVDDGESAPEASNPSRKPIVAIATIALAAVVALGVTGLFGPVAELIPSSGGDGDVSPEIGDGSQASVPTSATDSDENVDFSIDAGHQKADAEDVEDAAAVTDAPEHDRNVIDFSLGKFHTCIVLRDGRVRCWGANFEAELGVGHRDHIGDTEPASDAEFVELDGPAVAVSAAGDYNASFSCALLDGGELRCWGSNHFGQLGMGSEVRRVGSDVLPVEIDPVNVGGVVTQVTTGAMQYASHACALLDSGDLRCWGNNRHGQLGLGHTDHIGRAQVPANVNPVDVGGEITQIDAGKFHTCAVLAGGDLRCWGRNHTGQLGYGHTDNVGDDEHPSEAGDVDVGAPVERVSVGRSHTCAVVEGRRARCWGWNQFGQLGLGHDTDVGDDDVPADVDDVDVGGDVLDIAAGGLHTCALLEEGRVRCWGDNRFGQLGYGHRRRVGIDQKPADVANVHLGGPAVAIEAGNYHNCALLEDDTLRCWGFNKFGQLGYGHTDNIGSAQAPASAGPVPAY